MGFLKEFHVENDDTRDNKEILDLAFDLIERNNKTIAAIETILKEEQKKIVYVTSLFREDTLGVSLLTLLWGKREGKVFMENVVSPLIERILALEHPLEVLRFIPSFTLAA